MKLKKTFALLMAAMLAAGSLAGCGDDKDSTSGASKDTTKQDPYTVKILFPGEAKTEDCEEVSAAASKITEEKFNTKIDITRCGFGTYPQQVNLMLSSGEKLDLMYNNRDIFVSAVNNGQIVEIGKYLDEYGKEMKEQISEDNWACTSVGGKIYAVPANKELAVAWGFAFNTDMADATGYDYSNIKTEDDLIPLLDAVKEKFPDVYPIVGSGNMSLLTTDDNLGGDFGVLVDCTDKSDTTVVDFYHSDRYEEMVTKRWEWAQKGYIMPDVPANTEATASLLKADKGFGYYCNVKPGMEGEISKSSGKPIKCVWLTDVYTTTTRLDILWYIAHNSEKPERAVQVLNEIFINSDLANICINGIEGKHYVVNDEGLAAYPEGVDGASTGYASHPWGWPNEMISLVWEGSDPDLWEQTDQYNKDAIVSVGKGFSWDNAKVLNEVTACNNVKNKYAAALETGSIDPAENLPKFRKELEDAGVNTIIEEKQKQFDEWLKTQK